MKISEEYRALALDALRGKWKTAVLAGIIASAFGANIVSGSSSITSRSNQDSSFSIAVLKTHIINYAKTRPVYDAYRKSGYSKKFLEAHREEITLHKAAKAAFDEAGMKKLPKVKELDAEYAELLTKKKAAYPDYRKARNEIQELVRAQKNVERFFAEEKDTARCQVLDNFFHK